MNDTNSSEENNVLLLSARRYKLLLSCCMPLTFIATGLAASIISPTIIDMKAFYHCDYEQYSQAFMMKSFGILVGSYLGGIAVDRYRKYFNLCVFFNVFFMGVVSVLMPLYPNLILLGMLYALQGVCHGCLLVGCNSFNIALWSGKAPLSVYALHSAFTIGQAVGPLISKPFITHLNNTVVMNTGAPAIRISTPSQHFYMPYVIFASYCGLVSLVFLILNCSPGAKSIHSNNSKHKTFKDMFSFPVCGGGNVCFATFWLFGIFFAYFINVSRTSAMNIFLYPLAVESKLLISSDMAAYLQTVFYITGTAGRLATGILSLFIPIKILLFLLLSAAVCAYFGLAYFGLTTKFMFWVLVCSTIFFAAPVYPTLMTWSDRYMEVTGIVAAIIETGISAGVFTSSWISGVIYQRIGPQALLYYFFGCTSSLFLLIIFMQLIGMVHGDRYDETSKKLPKVEPVNEDNERKPLIN